MKLERIIEMLQAHIGQQRAAYSLAQARVDVPSTLAINEEIIESEHTLSILHHTVKRMQRNDFFDPVPEVQA